MCFRKRYIVLLSAPPWLKSLHVSDRLFVNENLRKDEILEVVESWLEQRPTQDIPMSRSGRNP